MRSFIPLVRLVLITSFLAGSSAFATDSIKFRLSDASNLRQIGQATLIFAQSNQDQFPHATDVWDYAEFLARDGGLESAQLWQSRSDPATESNDPAVTAVLLPNNVGRPTGKNPSFRRLRLSFAVPLGTLKATMPSTTPMAWTRGLQTDGTWAAHSPYGSTGGHIVFIGGNVLFFKNLNADGGELVRFDGKGKTSNILEALPPGTRIGEYVPTEIEQAAWAKIPRETGSAPFWSNHVDDLIAWVIWLSVIAVSWFFFQRNIIGSASLIIAWILFTTLLIVQLTGGFISVTKCY